MNSYQKMAKQRDETIFILKTEKRKLESMLHKENGSIDSTIAYILGQFQELFDLYEIK